MNIFINFMIFKDTAGMIDMMYGEQKIFHNSLSRLSVLFKCSAVLIWDQQCELQVHLI